MDRRPRSTMEGRRALLATASVLLACFVVSCAWLVVSGSLPGDRWILIELRQLLDDRGTETLQTVSDLTRTAGLVALGAVLLLTLVVLRRWAEAVLAALVIAVAMLGNPLLKRVFDRDRPELWPTGPVSEFSFPSGHASGSAALAGALILVAWNTRWRGAAIAVAGVGVAVIGFSQLALGVHHPSDLLAGWSWVGAWVCIVAAVRPARWVAGRSGVGHDDGRR